jgi:L-ascorbate metabolism protein UlaG (beta-lactamase superfamily)
MEITWYGHSCFSLTERNYVIISHDTPDHNNYVLLISHHS